jgi:hypothetical protein
VALGIPFDQAANLPTPLARIRDLERENQRLRADLQALRRQIGSPYESAYLLSSSKRFRSSSDLQSPSIPPNSMSNVSLNTIRVRVLFLQPPWFLIAFSVQLDNNLSAERMPCVPYPSGDLDTPVSYASTASFPPPAYPYGGYVSPDGAETTHTSGNHSPASPTASSCTKDDEAESQLTVVCCLILRDDFHLTDNNSDS